MSNWNPGQPPGGGGPPPGGGGYGGPPGGAPPGGGGYGPPGGAPPGGGGYGGPPPGGYGAPPPGGYGGPQQGFGPPQQQFGMQPNYIAPVQGSLGLGFCAGFFGGCIGLILVYAIAKGPETKKGAGMGFGAQIVVGIILRVIGSAMH